MPARSRNTLDANDAARRVDGSMRRLQQSSAPACRISRIMTVMRHAWSLLPGQHPSLGAQSPRSQVPSRRPATPQFGHEGLSSYQGHSFPNAAAKTPKAVTSDGYAHSCDRMLLGGQSARARAFESVRPFNDCNAQCHNVQAHAASRSLSDQRRTLIHSARTRASAMRCCLLLSTGWIASA